MKFVKSLLTLGLALGVSASVLAESSTISTIKDSATGSIKSSATESLSSAKTGATSSVSSAKSSMTDKVTSAKTGVTEKASSAKTSATNKVSAAKTSANEKVSGAKNTANSAASVNINTATAKQLQQLTGIGAAKAKAIVAYRKKNGAFTTVRQPDILIVEGLNVLQTGPTLMVSDLFDFSVYVDARTEDIEKWYIDRFLQLRDTAFRRPGAHFSHYADMADPESIAVARELWQSINLPNLVENILPTRVRASLVLKKGSDHLVERVRMRKI